ncbi:MAG: hypothetical protein SFT91_02955 [Rickettsiaceae bacterium]|nr:hypothetical protein [Rickettsiaceae bacterium]
MSDKPSPISDKTNATTDTESDVTDTTETSSVESGNSKKPRAIKKFRSAVKVITRKFRKTGPDVHSKSIGFSRRDGSITVYDDELGEYIALTNGDRFMRDVFLHKQTPGSGGTVEIKKSDRPKYQYVYNKDTKQLVNKFTGEVASTAGKQLRDKPQSQDAQKYVVSMSGELYIGGGDQSAKEFFAHSSFLNGESIMGGGVIRVKDGKITHIDDESGHYNCDQLDLYYVVKSIEEKMPEVFSPHATVVAYNAETGGNTIYGVESFRTAMEGGEKSPLYKQLEDKRTKATEDYEQEIIKAAEEAKKRTENLRKSLNTNPTTEDEIPPPVQPRAVAKKDNQR